MEKRKFGNYCIENVLAEGAMGIVYKAQDPNGNHVAIKALKNLEGSEKIKQRFRQEIRITNNLLHPNVVIPLHFEMEPVPFIVFEFIDGISLAKAMMGKDWLGFEDVVNIVEQIGLGLKYVHDLGVVHGDLKPKNIMLTKDNQNKTLVKIVDFGISNIKTSLVKFGDRFRVRENDNERDGVFGTPGYICPELFSSPELAETIPADLFSFGVIAHELMTRTTPFPGRAASRTLALPVVANFSDEFQKVLLKMLAKDPAQRYTTALDFIEAIDTLFRSPSFAKSWGRYIFDKMREEASGEHVSYNTKDLQDWEKEWEPYFSPTQTLPLQGFWDEETIKDPWQPDD